MSEIANNPAPDRPSGEPSGRGPDDVGRLLVVVNAALVGIPAAYAVSHSLAVTVLAAVLAVVLALACLARRNG
ncbi:hypothetical protein QLQ12_27490 [Actinoplanes sp. NEAU-A12]|uniref:Uncharacterized protein n=1 Tax=Actinoplanes sandaracinus TaxID=3045177 RepID=A0ABT6WRK6_9ACTN|nr:hypothetical protein [Actinoplanes sandaracinus]MDI6102368.1 hypothetical protein [Actinoplanes sandaracinus]